MLRVQCLPFNKTTFLDIVSHCEVSLHTIQSSGVAINSLEGGLAANNFTHLAMGQRGRFAVLKVISCNSTHFAMGQRGKCAVS
jgi:hypothetical protein